MRVKLNEWPPGTPDFVNHRVLEKYIQDTSRKSHVDQVTRYGARVTSVRKDGAAWHITWSTLTKDPVSGNLREKFEDAVRSSWTQLESLMADMMSFKRFDAVVVASGHYHAPRVPDIPGLADSKARWPANIQHSKAYRNPAGFEGKVSS